MGKNDNNNQLQLTGLNGDIRQPVIFPDSHFGLEQAVWDGAQKLLGMLPIDVKVTGDLQEEDVLTMIEKAKGAEIGSKHWAEYSSAFSRYLKAYKKTKDKQAEVAEGAAEALLEHTELEGELARTLAVLEAKRRTSIASTRSAIATTHDELVLDLQKISAQYTEGKNKRQQREKADNTKEATPIAKQSSLLVEKFRKARESRYSGAMLGITQRIGT